MIVHDLDIRRAFIGPHEADPVLLIDPDTVLPFPCAGIAEMLIQSHAGSLELLPALPAAWPEGEVTGLRARGGFEVDIAWRGGELHRATVTSLNGNPLVLRYRKQTAEVSSSQGSRHQFDAALQCRGDGTG